MRVESPEVLAARSRIHRIEAEIHGKQIDLAAAKRDLWRALRTDDDKRPPVKK